MGTCDEGAWREKHEDKLMERRAFLQLVGLAGVATALPLPALPALSALPVAKPKRLTGDDLVRMRDRGIPIAQSLLESVRRDANTHRNFGPCRCCDAKTWQQHEEWCDWCPIIMEDDWYERLKSCDFDVPRRIAVLKRGSSIQARTCFGQKAATAWLKSRYRVGDVVEIHPAGFVADNYLRRANVYQRG